MIERRATRHKRLIEVHEVTERSTPPKPPREDALPEHLQYRDTGCDLFASCLACPLPQCRYDVPGGARTMLNNVRDREIRRMHDEQELHVDEIAARFRVSRRTVFRVLQHGRDRNRPQHRQPRRRPSETPGDERTCQ